MQGIYTYISETNHVPREYIVASILSLLFMVPISQIFQFTKLEFHHGFKGSFNVKILRELLD